MLDGKYELADGQTLHVFTQSTGSRWTCIAYDHGPFCRRCQPMDGVMEALLENVVDGLVEVKADPDSAEFKFHVTEEGTARVKHMIESNDEGAAS